MSEKCSYYIIYLRDFAESEEWSHIHRFILRGGHSEPGWKGILCTDIDLSHHVFLSCKAKDNEDAGAKNIFLRYDLVASIVELASHNNLLGFVDSSQFQEFTEAIEPPNIS
jgi:hypothetical protein